MMHSLDFIKVKNKKNRKKQNKKLNKSFYTKNKSNAGPISSNSRVQETRVTITREGLNMTQRMTTTNYKMKATTNILLKKMTKQSNNKESTNASDDGVSENREQTTKQQWQYQGGIGIYSK